MSRLSAEEAAKRLGVKVTTVYAYASRGLLRSTSDGSDSRRRLYYESEVEQLKRRGEAHRGDKPAAAGALDWGAPVLETAISAITPAGPKYRGHIARTLVRERYTFESVVSLLWSQDFERIATPFDILESARRGGGGIASSSPQKSSREQERSVSTLDALDRIRIAVMQEGFEDLTRFSPAEQSQWQCGWRAIRAAMGSLSSPHEPPREPPSGDALQSGESLVASSLLAAWLPPEERSSEAVAALNAALVLVADHELNASTFAARVAASTGADLYACISAALATFTGPRHGGASARSEALLQKIDDLETSGVTGAAERVLMESLRHGERLAGLNHTLYPHGDPRAVVILEQLEDVPGADADAARRQHASLALAAEAMGLGAPNLDMALATLVRALRLPAGSASVVFAIGRMAGWIAHAMEQREGGQLLRPRARYVGPAHPE